MLNYPLVMTNSLPWKIITFNRYITSWYIIYFYGSFSIAMLNNQRVDVEKLIPTDLLYTPV